jgi:hemoglobin-like flavoprotein
VTNEPSRPATPDRTRLDDVPEKTIAIAKASYDRCCERADFFVCFYRNFFQNCPGVEPMFAQTDFERQNKLLRHAIGLLLIFPNQPADEPTILSRVAERHGPTDLNIDPELYPGFVESLVQTVAEHDAEFDTAVEDAWRRTIAPGIAYMLERR